jgi:hypothetical protein
MLSMQLRRMAVMLMGMERVTVRRVGMMRRLFVVAGLGMLGSFAMMLRGMLVMFRCHVMVLMDIVFAHRFSPGDSLEGANKIIGHDELVATVFRLM